MTNEDMKVIVGIDTHADTHHVALITEWTRTGLSLRRVLRQLRPLRSATIQANGAIQTLPPALGNNEQAILDDLKQASSRH